MKAVKTKKNQTIHPSRISFILLAHIDKHSFLYIHTHTTNIKGHDRTKSIISAKEGTL